MNLPELSPGDAKLMAACDAVAETHLTPFLALVDAGTPTVAAQVILRAAMYRTHGHFQQMLVDAVGDLRAQGLPDVTVTCEVGRDDVLYVISTPALGSYGTSVSLGMLSLDVIFENGTLHGPHRLAPAWDEVVRLYVSHLSARVSRLGSEYDARSVMRVTVSLLPLLREVIDKMFGAVFDEMLAAQVKVVRAVILALTGWDAGGRQGSPDAVVRGALAQVAAEDDRLSVGFERGSGAREWVAQTEPAPPVKQRGEA